MTSEQPPAPFLDLITPANAAELRVRAAEYEHPTRYVSALIEKYKSHRLYTSTLHMTTALIEPFTNANDSRKVRDMKAAFLAGNLLATEVIDIVGGEDLLDVVPDVTMKFDMPREGLTPEDAKKFFTAQVHFSGIETYQVATIYHPLIDSWGLKIAHRKQQESLRAGFGMVLNIGKAAIDQVERMAFEADIESGVNWEADMQILLTEEG